MKQQKFVTFSMLKGKNKSMQRNNARKGTEREMKMQNEMKTNGSGCEM